MDKSELRSWLAAWNLPEIRLAASRQSRMFGLLLALTYDSDPLIAWRAVEAIGLSAAVIVDRHTERVRNQLRRLVWLLNDESGGIGWRAPEAIGEIIYRCPSYFPDYIPILVSLIDMEPEDAPPFLPGYLFAVGQAAKVLRSEMQAALPYIAPCLDYRKAQIRGLAARCLIFLGPGTLLPKLQALSNDIAPVILYQEQALVTTSVAALASAAVRLVQEKVRQQPRIDQNIQ